jgi:hypothetical protein
MKKRIMLRTLWIFIICLYAVNIQYTDINYPIQKPKLEYSNGKPTTLSIDLYVNSNVNQKRFISEYQAYIKDSIYNDIYFRTEISKNVDNKNIILAYNFISQNSNCEIVIYDFEKYRALEYDSTKNNKYKYNDEDYFVKATIFHEISHYYFTQVMLEMTKIKHLNVNQYYTMSINTFPNIELQYGAKFIEEGFCEYIIQKWQLCPKFQEILIPQYKSDFLDKNLDFDIQYVFASKFLKDFLDRYTKQDGTIKQAIMIILGNRPPNYNEILKPEQYFNRLNLSLTPTTLSPVDSIYQ